MERDQARFDALAFLESLVNHDVIFDPDRKPGNVTIGVDADMIRDCVNGRPVVLIGNGPSAKDFEPSSEHCVVRMNYGILQGAADLWVNNIVGVKSPEGERSQYVLRLNAERGGYRLYDRYPKGLKNKTYFWTPNRYRAVAKLIGYEQPLTGTMALYWFLHNTPVPLVIVGYDFYKAGPGAMPRHELKYDRAFIERQAKLEEVTWLK